MPKNDKGDKFEDFDVIQLPAIDQKEYYQTSSIRKAVLLIRYVSLMKHFLRDTKRNVNNSPTYTVDLKTGITIPGHLAPTSELRTVTIIKILSNLLFSGMLREKTGQSLLGSFQKVHRVFRERSRTYK